MNKFLQGFLNIPNGRIVDIFKLNYKSMPDEYNSKDIIELVKKVYDIDVNLIVSNTISKINGAFGSDAHNLAEYFEDIIYQLDEKTGIQKNDDSKYGKIEYLLCNIYQIIMCVNYDNYYNLTELNNRFPSIVGKNDNDLISASTVRRSIKTYYEKNVISYLFLPDNVMKELSDKSATEIQEALKNNYVCSEAWEEVIVPAVLHGAKNVYMCGEDRSVNNLNWFYKNYYGTLEKVYQSLLTESSDSEDSKAQIVKELHKTSLHCNKYISEMIFSLNYYIDLSNLLRGKTDDYLNDILFDDFACTILIPDIKRKKFYSELIMNIYNVLGCFEYKKMSCIISQKIKYEATVYYPILMLAAIECVRQLARQENEDKNAARFFKKKLMESLGAISKTVFIFDKLKKSNSDSKKAKEAINDSKEAREAIHYYFFVNNEYYNRDDYTKFAAKITTYDFDYGELVKCYMKHGIDVFDKDDDEYDSAEDDEYDSAEDDEEDSTETEE